MRIFFTQRPRQLKPTLLIIFLSLFPYQAVSSNDYWDTACSFGEGVFSFGKKVSSAVKTTGEILSDITHKVKYTFVPVSPDHFPELTLGQLLTALEEGSLEEGDSATVCQSLHFDYMKDEYPGTLSFRAIDFGNLLGDTRFSLSPSKTLHTFLSGSVPEAGLTKSFRILRPEMSSTVSVGEDEEKWKKCCLYEYILSNPPTGTDFGRVYIRLTAWRTRRS